MASLLGTIFLIQLVLYILDTLGAATLPDLLWQLYNMLPGVNTAADVHEAQKLRREVVRLRKELQATSAQDQFARWAKLQRQYDAVVAKHDQQASKLKDARTRFDQRLNLARTIVTYALRFGVQAYYWRRPAFWLPQGWVPSPLEWLLALPRAPTGSVSVQVWGLACASILQLAAAAVAALWMLIMQQSSRTASVSSNQPVAMKTKEHDKAK